ncbi:uncharacterized protein LOC113671396 [Pocillopora damicornis]|uniref:uncharacterized protein LOC113671396 n=1 Tax=Pocillopora damicornis TaxID=46731 RepID=UPI000F54CB52|nr:uncharacterized protein LOC113671396 [Pocillopora damicornis]XP_027043374.1 uncharacterized protein LOC113671396 [Pocillopora damicornis]
MIKKIIQLILVATTCVMFEAFIAHTVATTGFEITLTQEKIYERLEGFKLVGHVTETFFADEFECGLRCLTTEGCLSCNIFSDGKCQLSNLTWQSSPNNLKGTVSSTYYGKDIRGWFSSRPAISCKHIVDAEDSKGKGEYWIDPENDGNPLKVLCDISDDGYLIGWHHQHPGHSCRHILESGGSGGKGVYWIDPERNEQPLLVYCDMTTDGGGWLLVSNYMITGSTAEDGVKLEGSYRKISEYYTERMALNLNAMKELKEFTNFTQLRFYCSKPGVRTLNLVTALNSTGEAVVQYFSGQTNVQPDACGSFIRLDDDNSKLAQSCHRWGKGNNNIFYVGK